MDLNKKTFDFSDVLELIKILRSENGCPWDRAQTHKSLSRCTVEEAYELENAVENDNIPNLIEELGDFLMQFALHIVIAEEGGEFSASEVYTSLCKKLIFRHSHVFGSVKADNVTDALANWEKQKKIEHKSTTLQKYLSEIPNNMSALLKTQKTQNRASKGGYEFCSVDDAIENLKSEIDELSAEVKKGDMDKITDEGGDLLFAAVNVLRLLSVDSETALLKSNRKFLQRVLTCEEILHQDNKKLTDLSKDEFDELWKKAKRANNN